MPKDELKRKLEHADYPFNPQAWSDMEKLLDADKRRRRAAFWWWSTAAGLFIAAGIGTWQLYMQTATLQHRLAERVAEMDKPAHATPNQEVIANYSTELSTTGSAAVSETVAERSGQASVSTTNLFQASHGAESGGVATTARKVMRSSRAANTRVHAGRLKMNLQPAGSNATVEAEDPAIVVQQPAARAVSPAAFMNLQSVTLEQEQEWLLSERANATDETETFVKPVKRKFSFELGAVGKSAASFAGKTPGPLPSFEAGMQGAFSFGRFFAVTTGVTAGQTNFRVQPATNSDSSANILRFDSRITELNIPVGIRVSPFSNSRWRVNLELGLGNHLKLREKFEVIYKPSQPSPVTNATDLQVVIQETFENSFANPDALNTQQTPAGKTAVLDVSDVALGGAERYYASGYAALGFDVRVVRQLWFSASGFASLKPQIGSQQLHQWNAGAGMGIYYRFR